MSKLYAVVELPTNRLYDGPFKTLDAAAKFAMAASALAAKNGKPNKYVAADMDKVHAVYKWWS